MCRIKNKRQDDQFKSLRRDDKTEDAFITKEVTLMIKHLINEIESVESIESFESSEFLVNSVNDHIIRKILDSKVIDHIFCNQSLFISYTLKIFICETNTRKKFTAKSTELIQMKLIDDQDRSTLVTLIEVLYSFQLQYNLISIIKLNKKRVDTLLSLLIKTFKLLMKNHVIIVVDIINNQYVLRKNFTKSRAKNFINKLRALAKLSGLEIQIWHTRMRHLRYDNLIKLQNQIDELNLMSESKSTEICDSYMIDRQKRNVNKTSRTSVSKFLEIVYTDLRKSLSRTQLNHAHYITFRNDWSNAIWVHLLRNKNQAFDAFKNFQINIERSVDNCKIITLRENNASEYIDQKFQDYLINQKINWDSRVSYVPEQNNEAERLNRTLMYKIQSMLKKRKIAKSMWDEIIKKIAYLFNQSSHYQHDKISYEMIKNKKSHLSHLRIIESTVWVHILTEKTKKLNDRFWKSILVNYEDENQYRICDSRIDKIHIIKDVKFDEMIHLRDLIDSDNDDDFWTHEDDKLLDSNFEIEDESAGISSKWRSKRKTVDNRVESSDLDEDLNSVRASTNNLTNALDQMMKNLNLDKENHFEIVSGDFSVDDDQIDEKIVQSQAFRQSDRERKASTLVKKIIQYDLRKKMLCANVIVRDKFAYKKLLKCYTHMIKVLITLINSDDQSNSTDQFDESQILNEAI